MYCPPNQAIALGPCRLGNLASLARTVGLRPRPAVLGPRSSAPGPPRFRPKSPPRHTDVKNVYRLRPRHRGVHDRTGFQLVEIMILVAVLAIAAAVALPRMSRTDDMRLRAAARLLIADLEYAQVESMAQGDAPRVVVFDAAGHAYHVARASEPDTPLDSPLGPFPYRTVFGQGRASALAGVTIHAYSLGGDNRVGFGLYGQLDQTAPATVTLACGGRRITITLDPTTGTSSVGPIQ